MFKDFVSVMLLCMMFSCQKGNVTQPASEVVTPDPSIAFNVNKVTLLQLVNKVRTTGCNCGVTKMPAVGTVTWNDQLSLAAYDHSKDMQSQNYFSHTAKNGTDPGARITAAGYVWRTYGENIALGYSSEQSVMDGWINSEGHCKNIMNPNFKEMGAGRQGDYWTQEFGTR